MYYVGARLYGRNAGLYAAAVLAEQLLYTALGHILTLDMGLAFFLTLAFGAGIVLALDPRADAAANRRWMHFAAAGCALAMLSKGLIGIVLPGAVVTVYMLSGAISGLLRKLHLCFGGSFSSRLRAVVHRSVGRQSGIRVVFLRHEHLQRYTRPSISATSHGDIFIPILTAGILPWLVTCVDAWSRDTKIAPKTRHSIRSVFRCSGRASSSILFGVRLQVAVVILPIFPALALLIGVRLTTIGGRMSVMAPRTDGGAGDCRIFRRALYGPARHRQHSGRTLSCPDAVAVRRRRDLAGRARSPPFTLGAKTACARPCSRAHWRGSPRRSCWSPAKMRFRLRIRPIMPRRSSSRT